MVEIVDSVGSPYSSWASWRSPASCPSARRASRVRGRVASMADSTPATGNCELPAVAAAPSRSPLRVRDTTSSTSCSPPLLAAAKATIL